MEDVKVKKPLAFNHKAPKARNYQLLLRTLLRATPKAAAAKAAPKSAPAPTKRKGAWQRPQEGKEVMDQEPSRPTLDSELLCKSDITGSYLMEATATEPVVQPRWHHSDCPARFQGFRSMLRASEMDGQGATVVIILLCCEHMCTLRRGPCCSCAWIFRVASYLCDVVPN